MVAGSVLLWKKNKIVAALLAFFLGTLGIHKFYLGKTTAGIIMLVFLALFRNPAPAASEPAKG